MRNYDWISKPLVLIAFSILPSAAILSYYFLLLKLPPDDKIITFSSLLTGILFTFIVNSIVKWIIALSNRTEGGKARNYLLLLAFAAGFIFPFIFFAIGGLVFAVSDGLALAEWFRVIWVAMIAGAMTGIPLWLFSLPWAFVVVYGLVRIHDPMIKG